MTQRPYVKNASDPRQVKKAKGVVENKEWHTLNDIRVVLSTKEGRRFYFWVINTLCHYDADDFNHSGSITFRSLGERNIGRVLKDHGYRASIDLMQEMDKENWEFLKEGEQDAGRKQGG